MPFLGARAALLAACASAALVVPAGTAHADDTVPFDPSTLIVQAHRGGPDLGGVENSLALFRKAVASPAVDRIETDVRATKDHVLLIEHDEKLRSACTPFTGVRVSTLTWKQVQTVRCDGEPISRVIDVLAFLKDYPDTSINLELKLDSKATEAEKYAFAKQAAQTVVAAHLPRSQVVFSSYYWRSFAAAVQKYGKGTTMTAMEFPTRTGPTKDVYANVRRAKADGVDLWTMPTRDASSGLIDFVKSYGGMTLGLGDRRSETDTRYALAYGLHTFTSDDPVSQRSSLDDLIQRVQDDPLSLSLTTTTVTPFAVLAPTTLKSDTQKDVSVFGSTRLPDTAIARLDGITFSVTITGHGKGKVELAPSGSRAGVDGVRQAIPDGTSTYTMRTTPGDGGKIRVRTTGTAKVSVTVTDYRTASY